MMKTNNSRKNLQQITTFSLRKSISGRPKKLHLLLTSFGSCTATSFLCTTMSSRFCWTWSFFCLWLFVLLRLVSLIIFKRWESLLELLLIRSPICSQWLLIRSPLLFWCFSIINLFHFWWTRHQSLVILNWGQINISQTLRSTPGSSSW